MTYLSILLRNLQPKANTPSGAFASRGSRQIDVQARLLDSLLAEKVHGKPGQAVVLLPATKKTNARASASPHNIQAKLLRRIFDYGLPCFFKRSHAVRGFFFNFLCCLLHAAQSPWRLHVLFSQGQFSVFNGMTPFQSFIFPGNPPHSELSCRYRHRKSSRRHNPLTGNIEVLYSL